jgi:chaperonin GroES
MAPGSSKSTPRAKRAAKKKAAIPDHIKLTADRVVVQVPQDGERRAKSGLLIPATAGPTIKRCVWADVVLVGPDARTVKAGDRVLFLPHVGLEVEIEGDEYLLLRERDVQAVAAQQAVDGKDPAHAPGQYL